MCFGHAPSSWRIPHGRPLAVIVTVVAQRMGKAEHEVSIESPYFVVREQGVEIMRNFTARGGKVRVLTNSAASTDEPPRSAPCGCCRFRTSSHVEDGEVESPRDAGPPAIRRSST